MILAVVTLSQDTERRVWQKNEQCPMVYAILGSSGMEDIKFKHAFGVQHGNTAAVERLGQHLKQILVEAYGESVKRWPKKIIYLREGINETQMLDVCPQEATNIQLCYSRAAAPPPAITSIVVNMAHGVRFFNMPGAAPPNSNIPPGTALFESSVRPGTIPNFFLVAHAGLKGTSKCPRYYIVRHEISPMATYPLQFWVHFCHELCYAYQV